jgi:hypothetical protein
MKRTVTNSGTTVSLAGPDSRLERRIFNVMVVAAAIAVVVSLPFASWRVTAGLLLGGALSLLNHHWLRSSTASAFSVIAHGAKPKLSIVTYVFRYLIITAIVFLAYKLNLVSLAATIAGLCSFVVALFAEAIRGFYFVIIHREEIS